MMREITVEISLLDPSTGVTYAEPRKDMNKTNVDTTPCLVITVNGVRAKE